MPSATLSQSHPFRRFGWRRFFVLALASASWFAPWTGRAAEFDALDALARANGQDYLDQRSALLVAHPGPWDIPAAVAHDWAAGLAAYILDAWLADRAQFDAWDAVPVLEKIGGDVRPHPATKVGARGVPYLVEQVWKTARVPQWGTEAYEALLRQPLGGVAELWSAVWRAAPAGPLGRLALHGVAGDPRDSARDLLLGVLGNPATDSATRIAGLTGLETDRPAYATTVLTRTLPVWVADADAVDAGLRALARQADDTARGALRTLALEGTRPTSERLGAIVAMAGQPLPEDVGTLGAVLGSVNPEALWKRAAGVLKAFPIESTRTLLHSLLGTPPTEDVRHWAIQALERKGTLVDVGPLQAVTQNPAVPEPLREEAGAAIRTIQGRAGLP